MREYKIGDKILCKHDANIFYAAKIINLEQKDGENVYTIHYQGWNSRYDEKIPHSEIGDRWQEHSDDVLEKSKSAVKELKEQLNKKNKRKSTVNEVRKSEGDSTSRASTPSQTGSRAASNISEKTLKTGYGMRKHEEPPIADFVRNRKEVNIAIPDILKQVMVDDYDQVTRQYRLNVLPAKVTVEQIIKDYAASLGRQVCKDEQLLVHYADAVAESDLVSTHATMLECSMGIQDFFDVTFGAHLLTKFERPQYVDFLEKNGKSSSEPPNKKRRGMKDQIDDAVTEGFRPSTVYGMTHLLRLFVRFGTLIQCSPWSDRALASIIRHVHDFLVFLVRNVDKYYDKEAYDTATQDYQRRAFST